MKKINILLITLILASLLFSMNSMATAEEIYILRLSSRMSEKHPLTQGASYFEKRLEEESKGRIEVEVFTDGVLGDEFESWEGIQQGTIDMQVTGSVGSFIPEWQFFTLPYLWTSENHWDAVVHSDNKLIKYMNELLLEKDMVNLGFFTGGSRHLITTEKAVKSLDDLKGISMRVWPNPVVISTWKKLGTNPSEISFGETYTALQTGVVKAAENALATFVQQSWYEPAKYLTLTGHEITVRALLIGKKQLEKLPEDLQKIVREVGAETAEYHQVKVAREEENIFINELKEAGLEVIELEDKEKWVEATSSIREEFAQKYNLLDLLDYLNETRKEFIK